MYHDLKLGYNAHLTIIAKQVGKEGLRSNSMHSMRGGCS